jgi:hypothetical protein
MCKARLRFQPGFLFFARRRNLQVGDNTYKYKTLIISKIQ